MKPFNSNKKTGSYLRSVLLQAILPFSYRTGIYQLLGVSHALGITDKRHPYHLVMNYHNRNNRYYSSLRSSLFSQYETHSNRSASQKSNASSFYSYKTRLSDSIAKSHPILSAMNPQINKYENDYNINKNHAQTSKTITSSQYNDPIKTAVPDVQQPSVPIENETFTENSSASPLLTSLQPSSLKHHTPHSNNRYAELTDFIKSLPDDTNDDLDIFKTTDSQNVSNSTSEISIKESAELPSTTAEHQNNVKSIQQFIIPGKTNRDLSMQSFAQANVIAQHKAFLEKNNSESETKNDQEAMHDDHYESNVIKTNNAPLETNYNYKKIDLSDCDFGTNQKTIHSPETRDGSLLESDHVYNYELNKHFHNDDTHGDSIFLASDARMVQLSHMSKLNIKSIDANFNRLLLSNNDHSQEQSSDTVSLKFSYLKQNKTIIKESGNEPVDSSQNIDTSVHEQARAQARTQVLNNQLATETRDGSPPESDHVYNYELNKHFHNDDTHGGSIFLASDARMVQLLHMSKLNIKSIDANFNRLLLSNNGHSQEQSSDSLSLKFSYLKQNKTIIKESENEPVDSSQNIDTSVHEQARAQARTQVPNNQLTTIRTRRSNMRTVTSNSFWERSYTTRFHLKTLR